MNKIFFTLVQSKTNYESFTTMLKDNNYINILNQIIPLDYLIRRIEKLNWKYLMKEKKDLDFEKHSLDKYDATDNFFWLVSYLRDVVKIP
jgi:hypothetical protein